MMASNSAAQSVRASIVDLAEKDLPELAGFVATQSGKDPAETIAHLTWLLVENPARRNDMALGCGARSSDGALVGCILYLPQMFIFRNNPVRVLGSTSFYVEEAHRGSGGAIFLKFARAAQGAPLFGNSANAIAAQLWKARGAKAIPDSDHELLGIIRWPSVVEEAMARRSVNASIARLAGAGMGWLRFVRSLKLQQNCANRLVKLSSVEQAKEITRAEASDAVTALRDQSYLKWRYDSKHDPSIALFAFTSHYAQTPTFVAVNERHRGHRGQICALNMLDLFPKPDAATTLAIVTALEDRYRDRADMIVLRGQDEACQKALVAAGFHRRSFESANGWLFDPRGLAPAKEWYFVPADGDWLI